MISRVLRRLGALLIRSHDSRFILDDLDELLARDLVNGVSPLRSRARYLKNLLASASAVWREKLRARVGAGPSWLDFKLGLRMLVRYPGLTVIGTLSMAFAIAIGAAFFDWVNQFVRPTVPFDEGDRVVALQNWDVAQRGRVDLSLHDLALWRESLGSVEDVGAARTVRRNLITADGRGEPVVLAETSASTFTVTRVPPLLGRALIDADEQPGQSVIVIGHEVWQTRFGGDPAVIGRTVSLAGEAATVVGVMPAGYEFPLFHDAWVPLRLNALDYPRGQGPGLDVIFGRLAPGVTLDQAHAELAAIGQRTAAEFPATSARLRPQVVPYARSFFYLPGLLTAALMSSNLLLVLFLVLVCANVALLMFARAATRERELIVRNALGASRGRIIGQLFTEALVLGGVAAAVGLGAAAFLLRWGMDAVTSIEELPFWFHNRLTPTTVLYGVLLSILGASVAGVVPALKVTGRAGEARLRSTATGGAPLRFGGVWTAVIVVQIAVTVAVPVHAFFLASQALRFRAVEASTPKDEYLSALLQLDRLNPDERTRGYGETVEELARRVLQEPGILGLTFAEDPVPELSQSRIELESAGALSDSVETRAGTASVDASYFDVMGLEVTSGRGLRAGDADSTSLAVVVNQAFVDRVMRGRSPLGQRVRYAGDPASEPWHEIVGVVMDAPGVRDLPRGSERLYHLLEPASATYMHLLLHTRGDPAAFAPRLRTIATAVNPALRLERLMPLDDVGRGTFQWLGFLFRITMSIGGVALVLALAGIYAVMSFTVARRQREIGVRVALGADAARVTAAIFRRPLAQVCAGVVLGALFAALVAWAEAPDLAIALTPGVLAKGAALVTSYASVMLCVCLLACIVPTRRALAVEPTEAFRADG